MPWPHCTCRTFFVSTWTERYSARDHREGQGLVIRREAGALVGARLPAATATTLELLTLCCSASPSRLALSGPRVVLHSRRCGPPAVACADGATDGAAP